MLLAINANNTNTKFAVIEGETIRGQWRIGTNPVCTDDEYAVWLSQLMSLGGIGREDINAAAIASVVPRANFELCALCREYFGVAPMVIGDPTISLGIEVLIDRPSEAGADRLMNAVGAHKQYGGPLIVVDFGTGTTLDVIDNHGNYVGGIIAPGIHLSVDALYEAAAKLPHIAVERPDRVIGRNTVDAMKSGVFWGYVGLVEGLIGRVRMEFGVPDMRAVATGGLARLFADSIETIDSTEPDLTLMGLCETYRRNRESGT